MDRDTVAVYDCVARQWAEKYSKSVAKLLQELALEYFHPKEETLEIGSGSGRDLIFLNKNGFPTTALDASEGLLRECKSHSPQYQYVLDSLPLLAKIGDESFANIYSSAVLMHLQLSDIPLALENIYRVLKLRGVFVFSYRPSLESNEREEDGRLFSSIKFDFITKELSRAGFEVLFYKSEDVDGSPFWHHFAVRKRLPA